MLWLKPDGRWAQETLALHGAPIGLWAPLFSFLFYRMRGVYKTSSVFPSTPPPFCGQCLWRWVSLQCCGQGVGVDVLMRFTSLEEHGMWQGDRDISFSQKHEQHGAVHHSAEEPYCLCPLQFPLTEHSVCATRTVPNIHRPCHTALCGTLVSCGRCGG